MPIIMRSFANHVWAPDGPFRRVCIYCGAWLDYSNGRIQVYGGHFTVSESIQAIVRRRSWKHLL